MKASSSSRPISGFKFNKYFLAAVAIAGATSCLLLLRIVNDYASRVKIEREEWSVRNRGHLISTVTIITLPPTVGELEQKSESPASTVETEKMNSSEVETVTADMPTTKAAEKVLSWSELASNCRMQYDPCVSPESNCCKWLDTCWEKSPADCEEEEKKEEFCCKYM